MVGQEPWETFRQELKSVRLELSNALRNALLPPIATGIPVAIDTVAGARVSGKVSRATVFGLHVTSTDRSRAVAVYVPMSAIDAIDVEPTWISEQLHEDPPGPEAPEPDPDLPPDDDDAAPDAAVVP